MNAEPMTDKQCEYIKKLLEQMKEYAGDHRDSYYEVVSRVYSRWHGWYYGKPFGTKVLKPVPKLTKKQASEFITLLKENPHSDWFCEAVAADIEKYAAAIGDRAVSFLKVWMEFTEKGEGFPSHVQTPEDEAVHLMFLEDEAAAE